MKILVIALLKLSQITYKIVPLSESELVDEIYIIRKKPGPEIKNVKYIILPPICKLTFFYLLLTPFYAIFSARRKKVDFILTYHFIPHGFFGYLAHLFTGKPFIYSQIDQDIVSILSHPLVGKLTIHILKSARFINTPGSSSVRFWVDNKIPQQKIISIHSTIDTNSTFYPAKVQKEYDFIFIGELNRNKQVDLLIRSLGCLIEKDINLKLCIVGDGAEKAYLQNIVKNSNLSNNVAFVGHQNDIRKFLLKSKVYILTSKSEGLPCSLLEAMACEIIPIAPDVGNISDVIKDGKTGFLIKNQSPSEIRIKMLQALEAFESNSTIMKNARKMIIENHSFQSAIYKWNTILLEMKNENNS